MDLSDFDHIFIVDTQVILEGRPLEELPWNELGGGKIALIFVPTVLSEVDAKKRDGRIGERARHFNRLVEHALDNSPPIAPLGALENVFLALPGIRPIDWNAVSNLDRSEADDRIVAEGLHLDIDHSVQLTMFSYDLRPRAAAKRNGLSVQKPPEDWILPPEPSPHEKELTRLKQKVRLLEQDQPKITLDLQCVPEGPIQLFRVSPLADDTARAYGDKLIANNPKYTKSGLQLGLSDYSYDSRYRDFVEDARSYPFKLHSGLERVFNQIMITVQISCVGDIGAEGLLVEVSSRRARLFSKLQVRPIFEPSPPVWTPGPISYIGPTLSDIIAKRDPHELAFDPLPKGETTAHLRCEDFRQGRSDEIVLFAELDPSLEESEVFSVKALARNMKGVIEGRLSVETSANTSEVVDLYDLEEKTVLKEEWSLSHFLSQENAEWIDF